MINEITTQITPLVKTLSERYRPRDLIQALLGIAFDLQLAQEPVSARALNNFKALAENAARTRLGKQI